MSPKPCKSAVWVVNRWMVPFEEVRAAFVKIIEDYDDEGMRCEGYEYQGGDAYAARKGIANSIRKTEVITCCCESLG